MIYVQGLQGRQGYTKLDNVLEIKKLEGINRDGYEILTKGVDEKYQTFSSNMLKKLTRINFAPSK